MRSATLILAMLFCLVGASVSANAASIRQIGAMKNQDMQSLWNVWKTKIEPQQYANTYSRGFQISGKGSNEDWLNILKQVHYMDRLGCSDVHAQYVRKYPGYYKEIVQHIFGRAGIAFDDSYNVFVQALTTAVDPANVGIATGYFTIHSVDADYDYIAIIDTLNNQALIVYAGYSELDFN